ncbi:TetR/AcrR family transcriptional regulator [Alkalibacter mobilis]|uniref:TetR/AcrR family transcriptional regulator n=1 Tax=Alkalibacter mobilis TaxID=2787712 RepID=UPI0018A0DB22|nr:TetR/AcrR family transcriptional regulator [Alkalibacter mobilis]MBF7096217.1 TetR/AcrR family transcriptional regulator [Alkalibacter mobilis]
MRVVKEPEIRKKEILKAAMEMFGIKGVQKSTMSDIANSADVTKGLVYYYFESKEKLIEEVINMFVMDTERHLKEIVQCADLDFLDKLSEILKLYFSTIGNNLSLMNISKTNPGLFELIKNRLSESAFDHTRGLVDQAIEKKVINIRYPEFVLKILIRGIADLYIEGVKDPSVFAVIIEQTLSLPEGSLKI